MRGRVCLVSGEKLCDFEMFGQVRAVRMHPSHPSTYGPEARGLRNKRKTELQKFCCKTLIFFFFNF